MKIVFGLSNGNVGLIWPGQIRFGLAWLNLQMGLVWRWGNRINRLGCFQPFERRTIRATSLSQNTAILGIGNQAIQGIFLFHVSSGRDSDTFRKEAQGQCQIASHKKDSVDVGPLSESECAADMLQKCCTRQQSNRLQIGCK